MRAVAWSGRALADLIAAIDYLAQRNLSAAQRIEARILETVAQLAQRPIGRPGKQPGIYEKRVTGHAISSSTPWTRMRVVNGCT